MPPTKSIPRLPTFEVDKAGLAKLLARKGKEFAVTELIQNAWDENTTEVHVTLEARDDGLYRITVEDDNPEGFADMRHAYTLFAESAKKGDPTKRGRFNLGEKLVIALCREASIVTTKGSILFDAGGRVMTPTGRKRGSVFTGILEMTSGEAAAVEAAVYTLIPPPGITTTFNLNDVPSRAPAGSFDASLRTEKADADGNLRPTTRKTTVTLYEPLEGEEAMLYEMGIPVVATGDRWHVDIGQKVPLNTDRDNVPPAFLRDVRALVLNHAHAALTPEQTRERWVTEALSDDRVEPDAVRAVVTGRFGEKAVISDPTDPEANHLAVQKGYTVVAGGSLPGEAWKNVRGAGVLLPAGQVTPSPNPQEGRDNAKRMNPEHYPAGIRNIVDFSREFGRRLLGADVTVHVLNDPQWKFYAAYGPRNVGRAGELTLNVGKLGFRWFEGGPTAKVIDLLIHEFGHHYADNHLHEDYYHALTRLAGAAVRLALDEPEFYAAFTPDAATVAA